MADVKASDLKGDADTIFEVLDDEWLAFCEAAAKEIVLQHAQKPDEVKEGDIAHYAMFLDKKFHEIAVQRIRKTAQFRAACIKADLAEGKVVKALDDLRELAALKTVLHDIYHEKFDDTE